MTDPQPNDTVIIVCLPVAEMWPEIASGSDLEACSDCEQPIWVAPSSWVIIRKHRQARLLCNGCAVKIMAEVPKDEISVRSANPANNSPWMQEQIKTFRDLFGI